ncbi:MAG: hypothetical protein M3020_02620 [Myxococcota bacterium]|nr:hypothetical protein [Myxococcota bacterium]
MKARLFELLNPLGRFSPLNPRHPLHPLRSVIGPRRPPGVVNAKRDESSEPSWLARFYGDPVRLDAVPVPNMEWWWQTIETDAVSLIINVQLFAVPLLGLVAQATVVVRYLNGSSGEQNEVAETHTSGVFDPGAPATFTAPGFRLGFVGNKYVVHVRKDGLDVHVETSLGPVTLLGDPQGTPGWYDLNPDGGIPVWASYRSRFGRTSGHVESDGKRTEIDGHARFDHQSLHFSARDTRAFSLPTLAESLLLRPQWIWYHARLRAVDAAGEDWPTLNLMLCRVTNGHTGTLMKLSGALCDDDGHSIAIERDSIRLSTAEPGTEELRGRVRAPSKLRARFSVNGDGSEKGWLRQWARASYNLAIEARRSDQGEIRDWTVRYPIVGPMRYEAQEVPVLIRGNCYALTEERLGVGRERARDQRFSIEGSGTQEILDMLGSVTIKA